MVGIDVFAGAGGMSLGAVLAGVDVAVAVELDSTAARTYAENHKRTSVLQRDVRSIGKPDLGALRIKVPIVLFGGPPCQGFSYSNQRTRGVKNPQNWLFQEFFRLAEILRPEWVVLENVKGIVNTEGGIFLEQMLEGLDKTGYSVIWGTLNAASFGVP